jgi:hypothetical protein
VIAGFSFALSVAMLSSQGPTKLACERSQTGLAHCSLTRSVALGWVDLRGFQIANLKEVQLDERIKESLEVADHKGGTAIDRNSVFGVLLVGDTSIVFDGYSYDRERQIRIAQQINDFLRNPDQPSLILSSRNYASDIFIIMAFGTSVVMIMLYLTRKKAK